MEQDSTTSSSSTDIEGEPIADLSRPLAPTSPKFNEPASSRGRAGRHRVARRRLPDWMKTARAALVLGIVLIFAGGFLANTAQTNGGTIRITNVSFSTSTG